MKKQTVRLALAMLLLGCIPMLCFALFSYYRISEPMRERQHTYNTQSLAQNYNAVERVVDSTLVAMDYFIKMGSLQEAMRMSMSGTDFQTYQQLKNELVRLQPFACMQANACLISLRNGWLINNSGLYRLDSAENKLLYQNYINMHTASDLLSYFPADELGSPATYDSFFHDDAIHVLRSIPFGSTERSTGLLLVKLPCSYLSQMLTNEEELGSVLVLDRNMRIVAGKGQYHVGEQFTNAGIIKQLDCLSESSGTFDSTDDTMGNVVVSFQRSAHGWTYVLISTQTGLANEFRSLGLTILLICGITFIVLLIATTLTSRRAFKPVSNIVAHLSEQEDYEPGTDPFQYISTGIFNMTRRQRELIAELAQQEQPIREYTAISLLQGTLTGETLERRRPMFTGIHEEWVKMVVVMRLHPSLIEENINSAGLLLTSLRQTVEERMQDRLAITPVIISNDLCVVLTFPEGEQDVYIRMKECAKELLSPLEQSDDALSVVGVGGRFTRLSHASRSYRQALSALSFGMFTGGEAVLFYDDHAMRRAFRPQAYLQTQDKLMTAMKSADESVTRKLLDQLCTDIFQDGMSRNECIVPMLNLLTELIALRQELSPEFSACLENGFSIYDAFLGLSTPDEMKEWLWTQMVYPCLDALSRLHNDQQRQLVRRVQEMIDTRFDKGITLEMCASELNYHTGHIRRVFQQVTGMSFTDCLNRRRMTAAKEWLVSTDMKIQDIAEQLDYSNSQNFIRYFRAFTGETPGAYRKRNQAPSPSDKQQE